MTAARLYGVVGLEGWPSTDNRCVSRGAIELPATVPLVAQLGSVTHQVGTIAPIRMATIGPEFRKVLDRLGVPSEAFPIIGDSVVWDDTAVGRWVIGRSVLTIPCGMSLTNVSIDLPDDEGELEEVMTGEGLLSVVGGRLAQVVLYDTGRGAWPQTRMWSDNE